MAGHFGQRILSHLGLDDSKNQDSPSMTHPMGRGLINEDERNLSATRPNNGTYPRIAKLSDGSLLASFTRFEKRTRILRISKSSDGGRSFFDFGEVTRGSGDVDNMFLVEAAPSVVLAAFRNHDLGPHGPTWFRITVCQSTDGGKNWKFLSQAAEKSAPFGLWEPFMRLGKAGEVHLTYSQEFAPNDQRTMLVVSPDQGKSWTKPVCIQGEGELLRDGMTGVAATQDHGRDALVMVFETTRYGTFNLEAVISYDDGASWCHRHEIFAPCRGRNAGAPQVASFADGSLAVVFMTDEDSERVEWVKHAAIKVVFASSPRNGKISWSAPSLISPASSFWPGIIALDHHTVLVTYDHGGPRGKTITWHTD